MTEKKEGNNKAMRDALVAINSIDTRGLKRLLCELVEADIFDGGQINKTISAVEMAKRALAAPMSNQGMLESPKDVNEKYIHIGDTVHMLNTSYDGDHEWDGIVTSLEYVGNGGGDDWLVHGEDGAAWACECEVVNQKGEQS